MKWLHVISSWTGLMIDSFGYIVGNGAHILLYCRLIAFLDTIEGERFNFILRQSNKYIMEFPSQGAIIN